MTAGGSSAVSTEARAAAVLAAHEMVGKSAPAREGHDCRLITKPHDGCGCTRIVVGCTGCDWVTEADGTQGDAHRAHLAAEIVAGLLATDDADTLRARIEAEWFNGNIAEDCRDRLLADREGDTDTLRARLAAVEAVLDTCKCTLQYPGFDRAPFTNTANCLAHGKSGGYYAIRRDLRAALGASATEGRSDG